MLTHPMAMPPYTSTEIRTVACEEDGLRVSRAAAMISIHVARTEILISGFSPSSLPNRCALLCNASGKKSTEAGSLTKTDRL
jgi:hypothetical protein